ncbi:sialic acid-binding Ig-like lectin 12 isoform X2 [Alosa sapidissima]|uniref:sialic acid-binding Ig-like lectin 12 isoform X2 n=1 Tax=Alosa sapidissima TaxID=34773 RepID=UPI001C09EF7A|nr:sialic acid-binding Ig-like lectin 12 isoform X2 [Alosa sapidissima]
MVEESLSGQLLYMMGVLLAVFSMSMSTSVVVREGQSVQMNCSFGVKETGFTSVTWLRQTDQSTPVSILTTFYDYQKNEASNANYHNGFSSKRFTWTVVANSICTLQIRDVSVSDSGLYYCGMQPGDHMVYHNATYLTITGVLLAVFSMSMSTSVVVREGQSVQMNCSFGVKETGFTSVTWLRQTDQSTPVSILTALYNYQKNEASNANYHNGFSSKRFTWTIVANSICTLQIRDVSVSDSGLYYCGMQPGDHMVYYNATYLTITDQTDAEPTEKVKEKGCSLSGVCTSVVLALGVLSAALILVVLVLVLTKHKDGLHSDPGDETQSPPEQESGVLRYSALGLAEREERRRTFHREDTESRVFYFAAR